MRRLLLVLALVFGCAPPTADDAAVQRDFAEHRSNVEVTLGGDVTRLLDDDTGPSGTHERFVVRLTGTTLTVLVDHNVSIAPRVPVTVGAHVLLHGEYVWNAEGGLVHFTHHDPELRHEGGWIELDGKRYQ